MQPWAPNGVEEGGLGGGSPTAVATGCDCDDGRWRLAATVRFTLSPAHKGHLARREKLVEVPVLDPAFRAELERDREPGGENV